MGGGHTESRVEQLSPKMDTLGRSQEFGWEDPLSKTEAGGAAPQLERTVVAPSDPA